MEKIKPIVEVDRIQQILDALHDYIVVGNLIPGTELPSERDLAEQLGVSRFSVREALRVARAQGLIEITRGRKPKVAEPSTGAAADIIALALKRSKKSLLDLIVARQGIEIQIARIAALKAKSVDIDAMIKTISSIEENRDDIELCVQRDIEFHNILVRATENIVFEVMLAPLMELLHDCRKATIQRGVDRIIEGHREILKAIKTHDSEKAAMAMRRHLDMAEEDVKQFIAENK